MNCGMYISDFCADMQLEVRLGRQPIVDFYTPDLYGLSISWKRCQDGCSFFSNFPMFVFCGYQGPLSSLADGLRAPRERRARDPQRGGSQPLLRASSPKGGETGVRENLYRKFNITSKVSDIDQKINTLCKLTHLNSFEEITTHLYRDSFYNLRKL